VPRKELSVNDLWRRIAWVLPGLTLVLFLAALGVSTAGAQATPMPQTGMQYTPFLVSVPTPPRWFRGADDQIHLVYELMLTNAFPVSVDLTALEVLNATDETAVASLDGEALKAATSLLSTPTPTTSFAPSSVGVVWLDLTFAHPGELPATIQHRLTVKVPPGLPVPESIVETSGSAEVDLRPPVVLGPPLAGARWVALGSCCDGPHRRAMQALNGGLHLSQRFAIDFNRLAPDDRAVTGDESLNTSYPSYGQPVLAVADATVVAAVDQYPDQIPNAPTGVTLENAEGNHVILDLGDGRYAFYAHLEPGSVAVQAGERVQQGQVIGALGNSGSSSGPHLHFHVMDGPSSLVSDGIPYVFAGFTLDGQVPPLDDVISLVDAGQLIPVDTTDAGPRHDALPLGRDMVTFPQTGS
jgi:murein DD-endopeptidase MepM/ murein hydrolase activator NlpD